MKGRVCGCTEGFGDVVWFDSDERVACIVVGSDRFVAGCVHASVIEKRSDGGLDGGHVLINLELALVAL